MKPIRNVIIAIAVAMSAATGAQAQKFALVDMEYILKNIPAYERASEQLNQQSKEMAGRSGSHTERSADAIQNYQNEVVFLSAEQKKTNEQAIVDKEKEAAELKRKYFAPDGELFKNAKAS